MKKELLNKWFRLLIKSGLIIIGSGILGFCLLIVAYLLPASNMKENVENSIEEIVEKGPNSFLITENKATKIDGYTDSIMMNNAIYGGDESILEKASAGYRYQYKNMTPFDSLVEYMEGNEEYEKESYARYWHGYLIFLKPLLMFLQYGDIKILNAILQVLLVGIVVVEMVKRNLGKYVYAFLGAIAFMFPMVIPMCMQYSTVYNITMMALIILLKKYDYILENKRFFEFYLIVGIVICYFDFMTYPLVSFGFLILMQILMEHKQNKLLTDYIIDIVRYSFAWGMGYIGIWGVKWIIASIFMKENVIKDAILSMLYRSSSETSDSGRLENFSRSDAILRNFDVICQPVCIVILGAVLLYSVIQIWKLKRMQIDYKLIVACIGVMCVPILWIALMANHSYVHYWMVYRVLSISAFAIGIVLISFADNTKNEESGICILK